MEFTEKERLMLVDLKREINTLSKELIGTTNDCENFNYVSFCQIIIEIQSKISTLSSYSSMKNYDLRKIEVYSDELMKLALTIDEDRKKGSLLLLSRFLVLKRAVLTLVSVVNSIEFDFHKKRFSINLKELSIGNIQLPNG